MLSGDELERYSRQIAITGFGLEGQQKLKRASVLLVGTGGLGCITASYLVMAGIGRIRIVDSDVVELSNMNRQILLWDEDLGRNKADSSAAKLRRMNPNSKIEAVEESVIKTNIAGLIRDCDMIVDAVDGLAVRHLLNEAALNAGIPFFHGAVHGFEGRAITIIPGETACLSCIYPERVPEIGPQVIGVTPAIIGCIQATEVIKYVTGIGQLLKNKLLIYNGLNMKFTELKVTKKSDCAICGHYGSEAK